MKISGSKFKEAFDKSGLTLREVGDSGGVTPGRVWQISTDEVSNVNPVAVRAMAKKMKVKPEELI